MVTLILKGRDFPLSDLHDLASLLSQPPIPLAEWSASDLCATFNMAGKVRGGCLAWTAFWEQCAQLSKPALQSG